jgi:hypothetical protein
MTSPHPTAPSTPEEAPILKQDRLGRVHLSPQRRDELLALYDSSAMSAPLFADWAGIKYQTLSRWLLKRRKAAAGDLDAEQVPNNETPPSTSKISWVEAQIHPQSMPGYSGPDSGGVVLHLPGGARVSAADARTMAELLRSLGAGIC